jgi:hypothetical protein
VRLIPAVSALCSQFSLSSFGTLTFDIDAAFSIADIGFAVYVITKLYSSKTVEAE